MFPNPLSDAIGFTESDLLANREGNLSQTQRAKLRRTGSLNTIGLALIGLIAAGLLVATAHDIALQAVPGVFSLLGLIAFAILTVVLIAQATIAFRRANQDLKSGKVNSVVGPILRGVFDSKTVRYKLKVGEVELEIPEKAYSVLAKGEKYKVYYAPTSRVILSMEKLVD